MRSVTFRGSRIGTPDSQVPPESQALGDGHEQPSSQREGKYSAHLLLAGERRAEGRGLDLSEETPDAQLGTQHPPLASDPQILSAPLQDHGGAFCPKHEVAEAQPGEKASPTTCQTLPENLQPPYAGTRVLLQGAWWFSQVC